MAPRARRGGELEVLRSRIAEAFVEAIFRRAGYRVSPPGREGAASRAVTVGGEAFRPVFLLRRPAGPAGPGRAAHRVIPIGVKYQAGVEAYLAEHGEELWARVGAQWPAFCLVWVTDRPAAGRSCFQVLDLATARTGEALATVDLHYVQDLDIYLTTVQEYEGLIRQIFPLLRFETAALR